MSGERKREFVASEGTPRAGVELGHSMGRSGGGSRSQTGDPRDIKVVDGETKMILSAPCPCLHQVLPTQVRWRLLVANAAI